MGKESHSDLVGGAFGSIQCTVVASISEYAVKIDVPCNCNSLFRKCERQSSHLGKTPCSEVNKVGQFQQTSLIIWKWYIQESDRPVPSAISALPKNNSSCPLLPTALPGTKVLAQWGPCVHSLFLMLGPGWMVFGLSWNLMTSTGPLQLYNLYSSCEELKRDVITLLSRNPGHCHVFCRPLSCGQGPNLWYICATWKATDWQIKDTFGGGGYELWKQIVAAAWVIWVPYSDEVHWSQTTGKSPSPGLPPLLHR